MISSTLAARLSAAGGRQADSQADRVLAFLHFVAVQMREKRDLRRRYARNTVASYRRRLEAAGIAPITSYAQLDWLLEQLALNDPFQRLEPAVRLLWVLNDDRHRTSDYARALFRELLASEVARQAREEAA